MDRRQVVVVGAGMAGLTAAYHLRKAELDVVVFETSERAGGRMTTGTLDGNLLERGTQFISSTYRTTLSLVRELGLEKNLRSLSPWLALVRERKPRRIRTGRAFVLGLIPLLGWSGSFRFAWHMATTRWPPTDNYSTWAALDDQDAATWCNSHFGPMATAYLVEPILEGTLFEGPEETSRAIPLAFFALSDLGRSKQLTLADGLGAVPQALAARLDVRFRTPVQGIRVEGDGVEVSVPGGAVQADQVVIATTASAAMKLFPQANLLEKKLMATTYSPTILIALATDRHWRTDKTLKDLLGLFIPRLERGTVASVTIESGRDPRRVAGGELLSVFLSGKAAAEMMGQSDDEIVQAVLPELEVYFRGVTTAKQLVHVLRWDEAIPRSPVGRSLDLAQYRRSPSPDRRVWLAGDYLGFPWIESAVETGAWAAKRILAARNPQ